MASGESFSNSYERYFTLSDSIRGLVMSGGRDINWVNEQLQEIINKPKPVLEIEGLPKVRVGEIIRFWEERFPRRGWAITKLLAPFYSPHLSFELKAAASGLEERVRRAVIWSRIVGDRPGIHHRVHLGELNIRQDPTWQCWFHERLLLFTDNLYHDADVRGFRSKVEEALDGAVLCNVRAGLERNGKGGKNWYIPKGTPWSLSRHMYENIVISLEYAVAATVLLLGDYDLEPFLGLWLTGNLPVGFTKDNKLILLCIV